MNIKVLQYIDNTNTAASANTQPQSTGTATADFDEVLDSAKKAAAALAIDKLVTESSNSSVDAAAVQRFFDQNGIHMNLNISSATGTPDTSAAAISSGTGASAPSGSVSSYKTEASGLSCSAELDAIFNEAADKYGVDVKFLKSIAKCESDFSAACTSSSGAMGIMQLMPATAASLGVTNAYDPYQNIMGGAKYISEKLAQYNGDKSLALAAYNAGSGNVAKYGGIPPFKETQNYVTKVLAYYNS
ncbi:lytic transglycosylase domain-containing protein [Agathobacter sp.]